MRSLLGLLLSLSAGCGLAAYDSLGVEQQVPEADAGTKPDAGEAPADAGTQPDAGLKSDAGEEPDSGEAPDGGEEPDAGDTCVDCGSLGCCDDHCCELVPSNEEALGGVGPSAIEAVVSNATLDLSSCPDATAIGRCALAGQDDGPPLCVCRVRSLVVTGELALQGTTALALVAERTIEIDGVVNLSGAQALPAAGALGSQSEAATGREGGAGGVAVATPALEPLVGGVAGQSACGVSGGPGGGALQLVAGESITVRGVIDAGGGGGPGGTAQDGCGGGAGGGSGGSVLLEAPRVVLAESAGVWANGGGGGGAAGSGTSNGSGGSGEPGARSFEPAKGGQGRDGQECAIGIFGTVRGGHGGSGAVEGAGAGPGEAAGSQKCATQEQWVGEGGGGGGTGRIRINTHTGCACAGTTSPAYSIGFVGTK